MEEILSLLTDRQHGVIGSANEVDVVGHRIVHGGEDFANAAEVNASIKNKIRSLFSLAPLHNPVNFECLELAEKSFPAARSLRYLIRPFIRPFLIMPTGMLYPKIFTKMNIYGFMDFMVSAINTL